MKILINTRNIKIIEKEKIYTGNVNTYIINVEYEEDRIPETWDQYWNLEGCNVNYGVKMD